MRLRSSLVMGLNPMLEASDARRAVARGSGAQRTRAASSGATLLPRLSATGFPQQKILQDELAVAGSKRRTADRAPQFAVAGLRSGLGSDHLIKRAAAWAREELHRRSGHDASPRLRFDAIRF